MRIAERKQTSSRIETVHHDAVYNDDGEIITEAYEATIEYPIIETIYRDATDEELAEFNKSLFEEPTTVDDLVEAIDILTSIVLGEEDDG